MKHASRFFSSIIATVSVISIVVVYPTPAHAAEQSFDDLSSDHFAFAAAKYLQDRGIFQGYSNGEGALPSFRPGAIMTRAAVIKTIVASLVPASEIQKITSSPFGDVPDGEWFTGYVEWARGPLGMIDSPPKKPNFFPSAPVKKAEYLKMLLLAYKKVQDNPIDPLASYSEITAPLALDTEESTAWFYPYMRYALASSMTTADQYGRLNPGKELTRAEVAVLLYRFLTYREGVRKQALLSAAETEILNVLRLLGSDEEQIRLAMQAAHRSLIHARGALDSQKTETEAALIRGAVKTAEGFISLVNAYKARIEGRLQDTVTHASNAWQLAQKAHEFAPGLRTITAQMQQIAESMANEAREALKQG